MRKWDTALITGASSGIGMEFARQLSGICNNLIIISRNNKKLEQLKIELEKKNKINVWVIDCDLTKAESILRIKNVISENNIIPDLFINCAGIGVFGKFIETDTSRELELMNLNIVNSTMLMKEIVIMMNRNNRGTILNVSSTIAFRKSPGWAVYSASKKFILSLSKTLSLEMKNSTIKIAVLCPGKTDTEFDLNSGNLENKSKKMPVSGLVTYTLRKLEKGKKIIIPGFKNKLKYYVFRFVPEFITDLIIQKL